MTQTEKTLRHLENCLHNLRDYKTDLAVDLFKIFSNRYERFSKIASEDDILILKRHIDELEPFVMLPKIKNKIYIVSDIENIQLIALSISDFELDRIKEIFSDRIICNATEDSDIGFIATLYIIEREKITLETDMCPRHMSLLQRYFNDVNLLKPYDIKKYDKFHLF